MVEGEAPYDHAAEGKARDGGALDPTAVHEPKKLLREHGEIRDAGRLAALAVTKQIIGQYIEVRYEGGKLPLPHGAIETQAMDKGQWRATALSLVGRFFSRPDTHGNVIGV